MHLHDVLRLWRDELLAEAPTVAVSEERATRFGNLLESMPRDVLPGGLRRDEPDGLHVRLLPATHETAPPASEQSLDSLEEQLGTQLPRAVELILRLHNGGRFFQPAVDGLDESLSLPLTLLSVTEMGEAYERLTTTLGQTLARRDDGKDGLFRVARRFGASKEKAEVLAAQLGRIAAGQSSSLEIIPLMTPPGRSNDLVCFVPSSGRGGRVGTAFAESGFLPEHSDEYPFEGVEGWLLAMVRGRGCQRLLFS